MGLIKPYYYAGERGNKGVGLKRPLHGKHRLAVPSKLPTSELQGRGVAQPEGGGSSLSGRVRNFFTAPPAADVRNVAIP